MTERELAILDELKRLDEQVHELEDCWVSFTTIVRNGERIEEVVEA